MRYQGRINGWKDDRGYGFVIPNGGGERAFVHIKAFSSKGRRPIEGDLITYEVQKDAKNRYSAVKIRFIGEAVAPRSNPGSLIAPILVPVFIFFLVVAVLMKWLPLQIIALYLIASLITFVVYAWDKSAARNNRWRTQESTLHFFSVVGGWPGALLAQRTLRHKYAKAEFQTVFWVTVVINSAALGWLMTSSGSAFIRSLLI